jgi:hypothetical protein
VRYCAKGYVASASETGIGYRQHPGNVSKPKQGETPAKTFKRERPEGGTPTEMIRPIKKPRDSRGPGTYKEAVTSIKTAIFRETYPEDAIWKNTRIIFWKNWLGCSVNLC